MTYKKRLYILIGLTAVLALLYTGGLVFNSDFAARRSFYVWLDAKTSEKTTRIVINNSHMGEYEILKQDNLWFVLHDDKVYPARQIRVQDFFDALSVRAAWSVRSSSASSHERFGLDDHASRVTVYVDNSVILDLLVGDDDVIRNETYFRKFGQNEVRSGDSSVKTYINNHPGNWYNLRLITGTDGEAVDINSVQRVSVQLPDESQVFSRRNRSWVVSGVEITNPDIPAVENYIRVILNTEGDGFSDSVSWEDTRLDYSRIALELGYGKIITIRLSAGDENGRVFAHVSGNDYIYSIPSWAAQRLYQPAESFEIR